MPKCQYSELAGPVAGVQARTGTLEGLVSQSADQPHRTPKTGVPLAGAGPRHPTALVWDAQRWLRSPSRHHLADATTLLYKISRAIALATGKQKEARAGPSPGLCPALPSPVPEVCSE